MSDAPLLSVGLAFGAGLLSFLSPCVLPLVPSYLTFVTGMSVDDLAASDGSRRWVATRHAALFVIGFGIVFIVLGATATTVGVLLARLLVPLQRVGGALVFLFGCYLLGTLRLPVLSRERRVHLARRPAGLAGSVVVGMAFGAGWTPCVGPVLASILLFAGTTGSMLRGEGLLAAYTLGLGLPFLGVALAFEWFLTRRSLIARWVRPIEIFTGLLLVVVGALLASGRFSMLTGFLAGFGQLTSIGT